MLTALALYFCEKISAIKLKLIGPDAAQNISIKILGIISVAKLLA